jgi:hypothetical protein
VARTGQGGSGRARAALVAKLQDRRNELTEATLTRVVGIADPRDTPDPSYLNGFRPTVVAALDYAIEVIGNQDRSSPPIPAPILVQTRLAAQAGVSLDTVLRRYFAGYTLLTDFIVDILTKGERTSREELKELLRTGAVLFDQVVEAISEEYALATKEQVPTSEQRQAERIRRLLAGELVDTAELCYDFGTNHLGLIAVGDGAIAAIAELAKLVDCQRLVTSPENDVVWAWFGTRARLDAGEVECLVGDDWPDHLRVAIGESSSGLSGWRLTHRQARATLPVAKRHSAGARRYADVALEASMLQDELLVTSLHELYLNPLADERDGGEALRQTLQAYISAGRNLSSAAALLGVSRRTVANRLRAVEGKLGRVLNGAMAEIEAALRLHELEGPNEPAPPVARG